MQPFHVYVVSDEADADFVEPFVRVLREHGWRVFDAVADPQPGDDAAEQRMTAASRSMWFAVVRGAGRPAELRAAVLALLERRKEDRTARVIPVHLVAPDGHDQSFADLPLLKPIDATSAEATAAAESVHRVALREGLRDWWDTRAEVALLRVAAEAGEPAGALAEVLRAQSGQVRAVHELELGDAVAGAQAEHALVRLVVLGGSTGGEAGVAQVRAWVEEAPERVVLGFLDGLSRSVRKRYQAEEAGRDALLDLAEAGDVSLVAFEDWGSLAAPLRDAVALRIQELRPSAEERPSAVLWDYERAYLDACCQGWQDGRALSLKAFGDRSALQRERGYVSLHAKEGRWQRQEDGTVQLLDAAALHTAKPVRERDNRRRRNRPKPIFLDELVAHPELPHVLVVGEAGSGKTVLLQHVAWCLACHHRAVEPPAEMRLELPSLCGTSGLVPVPLWLEASQLGSHLSDRPSTTALLPVLRDLLGRVTDERLREGLEQGRYLLLVDALDEVSDVVVRRRVVGLLQQLAGGTACRVVVTTRPTAHTGVTVGGPFERVEVAPLDEDRRQALIGRWVAAGAFDEQDVGRLQTALGELGKRLQSSARDGLTPLANPLLLTGVLLVFSGERRLPDNLADLYERMVRYLCDRATQVHGKAQRSELLTVVCHALQQTGTTSLSVREVCDALVQEGHHARTHDAEAALDDLAVTTGILRFETGERGPVVRPWHRSFQEYLAACHVAARTGSEQDIVQQLHASDVLYAPEWEGSLRFLVGVFGQRGKPRARGLVQALLDQCGEAEPRQQGRLLGLAAAGVVDYHAEYFEHPPLDLDLAAKVAAAFEADGVAWRWQDRRLALEALGRVPAGDPRLPDPCHSSDGWVEIPAGTYAIGGDDEAYRSLPAQEVSLGGFHLRAWPVTVGEFEAFVRDDAFRDVSLWEGGKHTLPRGWEAQRFRPNAPVVSVTWFAARAFCRWAQHRWKKPGAQGVLDLPDSVEWEAAARLGHDGTYPWGTEAPGKGDDARANYGWQGDALGAVTPVGMFPGGIRAGLLDMAGNVFEWCSSTYDDDTERRCHVDDASWREAPDAGEAPRVLRGGSWSFVARHLRCATRYWDHPWNRFDIVGFRVVFRPPSTGIDP